MRLFIKAITHLLFIGVVFNACKSVDTRNQLDEVVFADVSYNGTIKQLISNNCSYCHTGKTPSAGLDLSTYDNVVTAIKTRGLLNRINNASNPMPQSGLMSKEDRLKLQQWADNNFPMDAESTSQNNTTNNDDTFDAPEIIPINIDEKGFEFMSKMQGHWVGKMYLLGRDIPWFAFDYRAINSSQLHGLFEGGSMGNLFNTFFVAEYKGVKTIMLRNGGILSDVYRTSYFVLVEADNEEYLFVDAYGGKQIMWVKVSFKNDKMKMLTYTSRMGSNKPSRHMEFEGENLHADLSKKAAELYQFPTKEIVKKFPNGMPLPDWGNDYTAVTSASYIMQDANASYIELGEMANDPIQINDIDNIALANLSFKRTDLSKGKKISIYLSRKPLTNAEGVMPTAYGYIQENLMNEVILFPEVNEEEMEFQLTYLHSGTCYITFVVDNNGDMTPSKGDYYSESKRIELSSLTPLILTIDNITKTIQ